MLTKRQSTCAHHQILNFSKDFFNCPQIDDDLRIQLPYPIHDPFTPCDRDLVVDLQDREKTYKSEYKLTQNYFNYGQDTIMQQKFLENNCVNLPKKVLDFYHLQKPEMPFVCDYNPYFNGFLDLFNLNGKCYLIRPNNVDHNLWVTEEGNPLKTTRLNLGGETLTKPVFSLRTQTNNEVLLFCRQKNRVFLVKITNLNEELSITWSEKTKKNLLDAKLNEFNENHVGIVYENLEFSLFDINRKGKLFYFDLFNLKSIIQCEFNAKNSIALLSKRHLKIVDYRSDDCNILFEPNLSECDQFCTFKVMGNAVFTITRHFLIRTDLRFMKNYEYCSHLMQSSPNLIAFSDNNKFLALVNQENDKENVLFTGNSIINSLPRKIPTICDTFQKCRLFCDCLLMENLKKRLNFSLAGVAFSTKDNITHLYTSNCLGDIFKQTISNNCIDNASPIDYLYDWILKLPKTETVLHPTNVENLINVRLTLNMPFEKERGPEKEQCGNINGFLKEFSSKYATENLGNLGKEFSLIWDDEKGMDINSNTSQEGGVLPEVDSTSKVHDWIGSYFDEEL